MISVIIGTSNSEATLTPTLAALVPGAAAGQVREVIVADAGSADATAEIADIAGCEFFSTPALLAERLRSAAARARSPWLMFLRPGVVLGPSWIEESGRFMRQSELRGLTEARAAMFRRADDFDGQSPARDVLAALRLALARRSPEQGLLIAKNFYVRIGGHREAARDPEADLISRLGRRRTVVLRSGATPIRSA